MFLKTLKLVGFKSFSDRTRLDLRPGLTVVVGPNGSGKSNIVDAVAWVMGSQSPKSLRTDRMDDVIFAGTATRPGLGRAEVTLVFDNESGTLPLDLPEVSVTRRLYRDGSSDYEINGVGCRLLDIQELLSDSGIGKSQHVIIGQGRIDSVLGAGPDEHRAVIEDAAGILKHRVRKDKTLRRLERTDGDVLRLTDLLSELTRQMRPLKRQADAAARHGEIEGLARALRLHLSGRELVAIEADLSRHEKRMEAIDRRIAEIAEDRHDAQRALSILRSSAGDVGEALDRDSAAAARLETTAERLRRIGSVAHERARSLEQRLTGADERRRDLQAERTDLEEELAPLTQSIAKLRTEVESSERRFRSLEDEERSLADQESMTSEGAVAVVRGDLRSLDASSERDERELDDVRRRIAALEERREGERAERDRINGEIRTIDAGSEALRSRYADAEAARRRAQDAWEQAEARHGSAEVAAAGARAKLAGLEQAAGGLADPEARAIAERADGALGTIVGRLDVPSDLAAAVDAALGPWSDAIAYRGSEAILGTLERLKSEGRGGVPMVSGPVDAGDQFAAARRRAQALGVDPLVDQLGPDADRGLALALMGDVVVSASWTQGWRIVQAEPDVRVVTLEGDLITRTGVRVAHPDGATPAMLEAAGVEVEIAERELARAASLLAQARRVFDSTREEERDALEAVETMEASLAGATEAMAHLDRLLEGVTADLETLALRARALEDARAERAENRARLEERLAALEGEEAERQRAWEALVERRRHVAERRERARAEWQEASTQLRTNEDRLGLLQRRFDVVVGLIEDEDRTDVDPASIEQLLRVEESARAGVEAVRVHVDELRRRQAQLRARAGAAGGRIGAVQAVDDELGEESMELTRERSDLAVSVAEGRIRHESVAEALRRDLDADEETARAAPRPPVESDDLDGELRRLEAELRRMGPVNPLAAEEYAEKAERHAFLGAQLDDLEQARGELRSVIRALDEEIELRFLEAFAEAATAFETHFTVLFPGGRGRLRLTDPDEPLTSGIEIEAQPLGKKVAKMSLLSGGERSLAALAFLFAVFEARPSPFYVLDEVEAALDDANLRRFLRLLEAFRSEAQLVVVTHQQQTMEAADVLYGVTMEPGGSSTVVAKALNEPLAERSV